MFVVVDLSSADPGGRVPVARHRELLRVRLPGVAAEAQLQVHLQQLHPGRAVRARVLGQLPHTPGPHPRQVAAAPLWAVLPSSKITVIMIKTVVAFLLLVKVSPPQLALCVQNEPAGGPVPGADQLLQLRHRQDPQLGGHQRAGRLPLHLHLLRVLRHAQLRRRVEPGAGVL